MYQPPTALLLTFFIATSAMAASEPATYAGVAGARILDSGSFVVSGAGPFDREENFEVLRRPDGGQTLLNTITSASGAYRVQGRFDFDADWNSQSASGVGFFDGQPMSIDMRRAGKQVKIEVTPLRITTGARKAAKQAVTPCDPCFIDMSPSIHPMFVMTRHYDFAQGGEQTYQWAAQDLDHDRWVATTVRMRFDGEQALSRASGELMPIWYNGSDRVPTGDARDHSAARNLDFAARLGVDRWVTRCIFCGRRCAGRSQDRCSVVACNYRFWTTRGLIDRRPIWLARLSRAADQYCPNCRCGSVVRWGVIDRTLT